MKVYFHIFPISLQMLLGLVLYCHWLVVVLEQMVKLLRQGWEELSAITTACIFDGCSSDNNLKELSLENNFESVVSILSIWVIDLDLFSLIFIIRDVFLIILLDINVTVGLVSINLIELMLVLGSEKCEMVLLTHVVHSVELGHS